MSTVATLRVEAGVGRDAHFQPAIAALKSSPAFASWSTSSLGALAAVSSLRSFGGGQAVMVAGTKPEHVLLVVRGRLRVVRRAEKGREVTLETFRPGEVAFDALAWSDPEATLGEDWIAGETSLLLFIPRSELLSQLRAHPEAALTFCSQLERRLRDAKHQAAALVLEDVEQRLWDALVRLARRDGETGTDGTLVRRAPTQQELANMIGACRETVSRIVAEMGRQGLLQQRGRKLTLAPQFFALGQAERAA